MLCGNVRLTLCLRISILLIIHAMQLRCIIHYTVTQAHYNGYNEIFTSFLTKPMLWKSFILDHFGALFFATEPVRFHVTRLDRYSALYICIVLHCLWYRNKNRCNFSHNISSSRSQFIMDHHIHLTSKIC